MKLKTCILTLLIIAATAFSAYAATSLSAIARWPYTPVASFLHPSPNAVTSGTHKNYDPIDLIIWTTGDTVTVLKSGTMDLVTAFRVETSTIIHDIHYESDATTATLYIAAGKSGLLIYDLSAMTGTPALEPTLPELKGTLNLAPDNPGSIVVSETETKTVPEIDARGLGYHEGYIFLADSNFGMRVINVSDPVTPVEEPLTTQDADRISGYKQPDINGSYKTTGGYTNATVCEYEGKIYAFMLDYYYGLRVFDVTDPGVIAAPVSKDMRTNLLYGTIALVTGLFASETNGDLFAYVTAMDSYAQYSVASKLKILSHSGTLGATPITNTGYCQTPGDATGILVSDLTGFITDGNKGLQVVDFSAPPVDGEVLDYPVIGSYETETRGSYSVDLLGDDVYMAVAENGLQKIDVSTHSAPIHKKTVYSPVSGDAVFYDSNYTYLLDGDSGLFTGDSGLFIFDSSLPSYLSRMGYVVIDGTSHDIAVSGDQAYIANGGSGLRIVDVSTKSAPSLVPHPSGTPTADEAMAVAIYEKETSKFACVANGNTNPYLLINVTDPLNPGSPKAADTTGFTPGTAVDVAVHGNYAYYADGLGLKIVDLSDPTSPSVVAEKDTPGLAVAVAIFEQDSQIYAFIADSTQGIYIENVTDPLAIPATVAVIPPPDTGSYNHIDIQTHYAFAASGKNGITAFDITDPENPESVATYSTKSSAEQISAFVKDNTVYTAVAEKYNGLVINKVNETIDQEPAAPLESSTSSSCFIDSVSEGRLF